MIRETKLRGQHGKTLRLRGVVRDGHQVKATLPQDQMWCVFADRETGGVALEKTTGDGITQQTTGEYEVLISAEEVSQHLVNDQYRFEVVVRDSQSGDTLPLAKGILYMSWGLR